jgi:chemotaxis signal transduction protein
MQHKPFLWYGSCNTPSRDVAGGSTILSSLYRYIEFLRFQVAGRSLCVDVDQVLGVITLPPDLKELPSVIPFHQENIRVHSLEKLLEHEDRKPSGPQEIIVFTGNSENYGLAVDWIGQIYKVPVHRSVFRFPTSHRSQIKMFGIWGMAILGNELTLILEPQQLFNERESAEAPSSAQPETSSDTAPDRSDLLC